MSSLALAATVGLWLCFVFVMPPVLGCMFNNRPGLPADVYDVVAMLPPVACVSVQLLPWLCMTVLVICVNSTSAVPSVQL